MHVTHVLLDGVLQDKNTYPDASLLNVKGRGAGRWRDEGDHVSSVAVFTCWWSRRDEAPRQDGERSKAYERSDEPATGPGAYMEVRLIWLSQGRRDGNASK